jgi:hypothetical protein
MTQQISFEKSIQTTTTTATATNRHQIERLFFFVVVVVAVVIHLLFHCSSLVLFALKNVISVSNSCHLASLSFFQLAT